MNSLTSTHNSNNNHNHNNLLEKMCKKYKLNIHDMKYYKFKYYDEMNNEKHKYIFISRL